jgi:hypothetical protein
MADETARNYLRDLGYLVREYAEEAKAEAAKYKVGSEADFQSGRLMAYYEVASLMKSQAEAFEIPLEDLAFGGFDPDGLMGLSST